MMETLGQLAPEWDSRHWRALSKRGWAKLGGQGAWGMCPHGTLKRGEQLTPVSPPPSGTQNAGGPLANEGGQKLGVQGGVGGVPYKTKIRG